MKEIRSIVSSFRKTAIKAVCMLLVLTVAGTSTACAVGNHKEETMDRNAALEYALADAGLKMEDIVLMKQELKKDGGENYYEIAFNGSDHSYQYEIDAVTGTVEGVKIQALSMQTPEGTEQSTAQIPEGTEQSATQSPAESGQSEQQERGGREGASAAQGDQNSDASQAPVDVQPSEEQNQTGNQAEQIDLETAKATALADAGLKETDVTFTKQETDRDYRGTEYDIEFYTAEAEYEYEISAETGMIIDKSVEQFQVPGAVSGGGADNADGYIGLERAKEIAVGDAGFGLEEVVLTKAELDWDDGRAEYEIEFQKECEEFEYCINALDGSILEFDYDHDDHCSRNHTHHGYRGY
ncbi:PepSY domain-containing protein [Acetatifactor muris]|uniref:Peptidase propeptide and YPEB domain protein n=1 Tax=Acetatifactor muris TaxID=879566 RepID=A0A2K4ZF46_9FIRM|nr:PepSY domain-containing protein [Acetatifactor muris]MCI8799212.1 hypothetical protein [Lachnospiraceae bacterium]MCR2047286.1 PepSY domain-containing protein [Acetatifactor muris]SOY29092.1 Peptidase propeptide and YPEB domain protein [Acetatifactor muris]